jgi:amino acid transporter
MWRASSPVLAMPENPPSAESSEPRLVRGLGLWQAASLNVANMVGIGPFITIPGFIAAMNGPQALVAWVMAAVLVLCDGLVWSELGAALPGSGGSYHFLREIFGGYRWGQLLPFLFIWQFLISGALEMASGYIGALQYLEYAVPQLKLSAFSAVPGGVRWIAAGAALLVALLLCQHIRRIGWFGMVLCGGTLTTVAVVIAAGLMNFNPALLRLPEGAFHLDAAFAKGLGAAMLIAIYDYLGYFNVCHLGEEVHEPGKTIPRAVMLSVVVVATVYLTMNTAIIGVVPWQEAMKSENIAAQFMEKLYGRPVAVAFTSLILWTVAACMFAITLGYSRIPYAAATRGDFFRVFAYVHPRGRFPMVSLLVLGLLTAAFCFLDLGTVISAAVAVRILVQFVGQIVGLHVLRKTRPDVVLPFRMWLYPLPSLVALAGWLFVFSTTETKVLLASLGVIGSGCAAFAIWKAWPYARRRGA